MLKINKKVEYALMVLQHMYQNKHQSTSVREMSERFDIPFDTTSKVMQKLSGHGIVQSIRGPRGGYFLNKELENVGYLELVEIIEEKKKQGHCIDSDCRLVGNCTIHTPIENLNNTIMAHLKKMNLKDLLSKERPSLTRMHL